MIQINIRVHYTVYSIQGVKTYCKDSTADTGGKWIGGPPKCTLASNIPIDSHQGGTTAWISVFSVHLVDGPGFCPPWPNLTLAAVLLWQR